MAKKRNTFSTQIMIKWFFIQGIDGGVEVKMIPNLETVDNPWHENWLNRFPFRTSPGCVAPTTIHNNHQTFSHSSVNHFSFLEPGDLCVFQPFVLNPRLFIFFPLVYILRCSGVLHSPTVRHLHCFAILETQGHPRRSFTRDFLQLSTQLRQKETGNSKLTTRTPLKMRNVHLLFSLILSVAAFSASANPTATVSQTTGIARRSDNPSKTTNASNGAPTAGEGDPIEGDATPTDEPTSDQKSGQSGSGKPASTRSKKISADAQPGGVVMQTPALTDGYQIYKIGQPVTFKWNYTSIQASPTAINVEAYCTDGATYFTIAGNISADTTEAVWDTGDYQQSATAKLPVATYTLWIYDSSKDRTAVPSPGYLYGYNSLQFGMYSPKAAVPLKDFQCPACDFNSAGLNDPRTVRALLGMGLVTALTFVWFIAGVL
ncbi:hypothetical protein L873DRAFT_1791612 [Choiromyces venosus 120613-1]|uniref:DUF7137 domain-containing protein n=1 Tax=Choiromyces venosus 120613-1 TaxID=1336337 RepID=A0A3N4JDU8_9PEZI|nr:hypothetical protein L873DRAFT_1791612 [Choiromyces venosus 120613-1]